MWLHKRENSLRRHRGKDASAVFVGIKLERGDGDVIPADGLSEGTARPAFPPGHRNLHYERAMWCVLGLDICL